MVLTLLDPLKAIILSGFDEGEPFYSVSFEDLFAALVEMITEGERERDRPFSDSLLCGKNGHT